MLREPVTSARATPRLDWADARIPCMMIGATTGRVSLWGFSRCRGRSRETRSTNHLVWWIVRPEDSTESARGGGVEGFAV